MIRSIRLSRHELHSLVILLEEKIDRFVQNGDDGSLKSARQLGNLRTKIKREMDKCSIHTN